MNSPRQGSASPWQSCLLSRHSTSVPRISSLVQSLHIERLVMQRTSTKQCLRHGPLASVAIRKLTRKARLYSCRVAKGDESATLAARTERSWASSVCALSRQCHDSFLPKLPNPTASLEWQVTPFRSSSLVIMFNISDPDLFQS